jgi:putative methyltransferase (TIGR04325 family)
MGSTVAHWLPPAVVEVAHRAAPARLRRFEPSASWAEATARTGGYESVAQQSLVHLPDPDPAQLERLGQRELQLVAALGIVLAQSPPGASLSVVDLGGASGYYRSVAAAAFPERELEWTVVENPTLAARGAQASSTAGLSWTTDLSAALAKSPDFVLASAVINYLPDPIEVLQSIAARTLWLLVTRLPLWPIPQHRAAVQRLGRRREAGSYPTWFFSERQLLRQLERDWRLVLRYEVPQDAAFFDGTWSTYAGLLLQARAR